MGKEATANEEGNPRLGFKVHNDVLNYAIHSAGGNLSATL